jgi:predicted dehydrogenase
VARIAVGIVGTGFSASSHVEALRRLPTVEVAAVAGRTEERARAAADRLGVPRSFGDYRDLLADDAIASVHNCTPNDLHAEITTAALERGKHVLSEKPLALDSGETGTLVAAAQGAGTVTGVCFNYRHYPLVRQVREMLAGGDYGRAVIVHGSYLQDWLLHDTDWNWRLESARAGSSRAVADIGSHWVDNVEYVVGDRVARVMAQLGRLHDTRSRPRGEVETFSSADGAERERVPVDTEDFAAVLLDFAGGARGSLTVSQVSAGRKNRLSWEIDTPAAAFAWDQEEPNRLWIGRRGAPNEELVRDPSLLAGPAAALAHLPGGHQEGWPDALANLVADFYAAVAAHGDNGRRHVSSFASFADAHHVTQVVEAILASDRSGAWVEVGARQEASA